MPDLGRPYGRRARLAAALRSAQPSRRATCMRCRPPRWWDMVLPVFARARLAGRAPALSTLVFLPCGSQVPGALLRHPSTPDARAALAKLPGRARSAVRVKRDALAQRLALARPFVRVRLPDPGKPPVLVRVPVLAR